MSEIIQLSKEVEIAFDLMTFCGMRPHHIVKTEEAATLSNVSHFSAKLIVRGIHPAAGKMKVIGHENGLSHC